LLLVVVLSCQHNNGGCDHVCNETMSAIICSCHYGYQLANKQDCAGIGLYIVKVFPQIKSWMFISLIESKV